MLKANHDWPRPRFFGVARSGRKNQNLNSIYSITGRNEECTGVGKASPVCFLRTEETGDGLLSAVTRASFKALVTKIRIWIFG